MIRRSLSLGLCAGLILLLSAPGSAQFPLRRAPAVIFINPDTTLTTQFQMGTGTGNASSTGTPQIDIDEVATAANTTETTLLSYTFPANSMVRREQGFRLFAWGITGANGNTKTIRVRFGPNTNRTEDVLNNNLSGAYNNVTWAVEVWAYRDSTTALKAYARTLQGTTWTHYATIPAPSTGSHDFTAAMLIRLTGQNGTATATDITAEGMMMEFYNN